MTKFVNVFIVCSYLFLTGCRSSADKLVGVKIYSVPGNVNALVDQWHQMGINAAFVSKGLLMDDEFRTVARNNDIQLFLIAPVFYNPEKLQQYPTWYAKDQQGNIAQADWVEFICPTQAAYRTLLADSLVQIVQTYQPDGLSIDFIRHFVFWEMVHPNTDLAQLPQTCFCPHCVNEFSEAKSISLTVSADSTSLVAREIQTHYDDQWQEWRRKIITDAFISLAEQVKKVKPDLKINLHAVPWLPQEKEGQLWTLTGQDVEAIAPYCTYVSPMCYHYMVHQPVDWISTRVEGLNQLAPGKILPSIQVGNAYRTEKFMKEEFEQALQQALKGSSQGVVFWSWDYLEKEPEKKSVIRL